MIVALLLAASGFSHGALLDRMLEHGIAGKAFAGLADRVIRVQVSGDDKDDDAADTDDSDDDAPAGLPPVAPVAPLPPLAPVPPLGPSATDAERRLHDQLQAAHDRAQAGRDRAQAALDRARSALDRKSFRFEFHGDDAPLPRFSETGKGVGTVDLLHRITRTAGWSMTLVGSPRETVDIDVKDADPRDALRAVLKQSGAMGVLKRDRLVVVASPDSNTAGLLVEQSSRHGRHRGGSAGHSNDLVRVFQGDLTVPQGTVVQGDVVCVGGSIELEPGSVVQGDAVAVMGSVFVNEGALVLGQGVAVLGDVDVQRGGQVMGEHVQIGLGRLFSRSRKGRSFLSSVGPFGFFPTLALFALTYLLGLLALRMWPERVRQVGHAFFETPVRSFFVGFLCWLLLLPLVVLLCISIVGIPLVPLLPVAIFLSIVLGLSAFALTLGEALPAGPGQRFVPPAALGMGMAVLLLLGLVPWLGVSLLALLQFFALGAAVGSRFGRALPPHVDRPAQ